MLSRPSCDKLEVQQIRIGERDSLVSFGFRVLLGRGGWEWESQQSALSGMKRIFYWKKIEDGISIAYNVAYVTERKK